MVRNTQQIDLNNLKEKQDINTLSYVKKTLEMVTIMGWCMDYSFDVCVNTCCEWISY